MGDINTAFLYSDETKPSQQYRLTGLVMHGSQCTLSRGKFAIANVSHTVLYVICWKLKLHEMTAIKFIGLVECMLEWLSMSLVVVIGTGTQVKRKVLHAGTVSLVVVAMQDISTDM